MAPIFSHLKQFPELEKIGKYSKMRGVTLLEMLIALLIASVMLTIGIPSFRTVLDNQRLTSATNELVMSLKLAKSEAIKRVAYVTVCKSNNGVSCTAGSWDDVWIVFTNDGVANQACIVDGLGGCTESMSAEEEEKAKKKKDDDDDDSKPPPPPGDPPTPAISNPNHSVTTTTISGADGLGLLFWKELIPEE